MSKEILDNIKSHLGYNDEEMKIFLADPKNLEVLKKAPYLMNKTIVIEVVESHGCNSQHKVGDKFYFDGFGNLLTKLSPSRICISALGAVEKLIYAASALMYTGQDPNEKLFPVRTGCPDVGLKCGGWGNIVMEIKVVDRKR
ncbi:MAG: TIGR04076 family protein [Promethearchaeota archaeon]